MRIGTVGAIALALAVPIFADFSYQETSRMTGGFLVKMAKFPGMGKALEPQVSHVYLKGNKLARVSPNSINVIDLDAETMTDVDLDKKQYSVITFAELAQAMDAMSKKMQREMAKAKKEGQQAPEMKFDVQVKETGQTRVIEGYSAKEFQMLMSMASSDQSTGQASTMRFDNSIWTTAEIAGYQEINDFYMRMAKKVNWLPQARNMAAMMKTQPGLGEGMAKMAMEAQKIKGTTLLTVSSIIMLGADGQPVQTPEMEMPNVGEAARESAQSSAGSAAGQAIGGRVGGALGGALGGFGGFGKKKKKEEPKAEPEQPKQQAPAAKPAGKPGLFMEVTVESTNHSRGAVDAAKLAVPSGFKEVEHEMKKMIREEAGR